MKKASLFFIGILITSSLLIGCTSGPVEEPDTEAEAIMTESMDLSIENFAFAPQTVTVNTGTTVTWTNNDSAAHTVTSTEGPESFASQTLKSGETFSVNFDTAGTYEYMCTIHPSMKGTVVVTP